MKLDNKLIKILSTKNSSKFNFQKYLESKKLPKDQIIKISYDFQSGTYLKNYLKNPNEDKALINYYSLLIKKNFNNVNSILDFGCGELTRTIQIKKKLPKKIKFFANDNSFNRMNIGLNYFKKEKNLNIFLCDNLNLPFKDSSIDLIITCHSLEPNNHSKKKIIKELLRVSRLGAIFLEPSYENATDLVKKRMRYFNYIRGIPSILKKNSKINFKIEINPHPINKNNTSAFYIIKKKKITKSSLNPVYYIEKNTLKNINDYLYSKNELSIYPIINNISILKKKFKIFLPKL